MSDNRFVNALAGYRGHLLALIAGALMPLAFSPFGLFPLAVLLIAALFLLCGCVTPRQAALRGLLFGTGMFGFGVTWIYISIHVYGYVNAPLSLFITALLVMVLALFPAFFSYFAARNHRCFADPLLLIAFYPALWVLFEWVRGWFFTGFPWLSLGYSQTDSPLAGYAPLLGVYGVSWIVALSAGLLLVALLNRVKKLRLCSVLALAILWGGGALGNLLEWGEPVGEPITVSIIQGNISQDIKWLPEMRQPTLDLYAKLTREHWDSDLIIWPESALPSFYHRAEGFIDTLAQEARAHDTDILLGVLSLRKNP
ncbi:MAG: apolipoprotein N-acyltransferase, partial [Gammaproteobacteria bacterium]|nr:apolipoprotein N-acyltransferase [Gammaproteobacteria bacterium]